MYSLETIPNTLLLVLNSTDTTITETTNQTFNIAFLKNGVFKWNVVCRDTLNRAGNSSKANFSKSRVYSTAPTVTLQKPVNAYNQTANSTVLFNCSATDNNGLQNFSLYLNTSGWHLNESKIKKGISNASNFTVINIKDGTYKWNCKVSDNSSNTAFASSNRTFTIDTTNPVVGNVFPKNNTKYTFVGMNFTYNVTDVTSAVSNCSLWLSADNSTSLVKNSTDTSITENINQTFNITFLENGVFKWNVVCTDKLNNKGNSSKANFSISRVDSTAPTVTLQKPVNAYNQTANATVLFNCSATDNKGLQNFSLYLNTSGWHLNESKIKRGISNSSNFTVINIKDGTYKWNCKASDNSSNTA